MDFFQRVFVTPECLTNLKLTRVPHSLCRGSVGCCKCNVRGRYITSLNKMLYLNLRRFLPQGHPWRKDPTFGPPCTLPPYRLCTHASIREAGQEADLAYASGVLRNADDDPARVTGVMGTPVTAELEGYDAAESELLDAMHIISNQGNNKCSDISITCA
jgi:hypothetical protein